MDLQKYKAIEEECAAALRVLLMKYTEELLSVFIAEVRDSVPMPNPPHENNSHGREGVNYIDKLKKTWKKRSVIGKSVRILIGLHKGKIGNIVDQKGAFLSVRMACGRTINYLPKYLNIN